MSSIPALNFNEQEGIGVTAAKYLPTTLLAFALGPLWFVGSVFVHRHLDRRGLRGSILFLVLAALGVLYFLVSLPLWKEWYQTFLGGESFEAYRSLGFAWLASLPGIPTGGVVMKGSHWLIDHLRPKTFEEQVQEKQRQEEHILELQSRYAEQIAHNVPNHPALLLLGAWHTSGGGGVFDGTDGISTFQNFIGLTDDVTREHMFILGATGSGKTETIRRFIWEKLTKTADDIILIDGKGDEKLAKDVQTMAYHTGRGIAPIVRLGTKEPGDTYDGFRGTSNAIWNRLCAMIGIPEAEGDSAYYARIARDILQLVCYAPEGPPRSFKELLERIDIDWLLNTYLTDVEEARVVQSLDKERVRDLATAFRPLYREFKNLINPHGFAIEDVRAAIFSLRTQSALDSGQQFLKFFVDDVRDYVGNRQQRKATLIIDEFAAFGIETIVNLLSLARSAGLGIVISAQDVSMLGDEALQKRITSNTRTMIMMNTTYPELIAMLAGTHYQVEASVQMIEGQLSGVQSGRVQHTFNVTPNAVRSLRKGEAFVIRNNVSAKLKISRVEHSLEPPDEQIPQEVHRPQPEEQEENRPIRKL